MTKGEFIQYAMEHMTKKQLLDFLGGLSDEQFHREETFSVCEATLQIGRSAPMSCTLPYGHRSQHQCGSTRWGADMEAHERKERELQAKAEADPCPATDMDPHGRTHRCRLYRGHWGGHECGSYGWFGDNGEKA